MEIHNSKYGAECGFVAKAPLSAHIGICAAEWNAGDGTSGKQDVVLFFSRALDPKRFLPTFSVDNSDMLI
jgi:hypothetical protein